MSQAVLVEDDVDYHSAVFAALRSISPKWFVHSFTRGKDAVLFSSKIQTPPRIAIVDIGLPDISGLEVIEKFKQELPTTKILVYTVVPTAYMLRQAIARGAIGYILKDDEFNTISSAIAQALAGYAPISPKMTKSLLSCVPCAEVKQAHGPRLSQQEQILLELVAAGNSYAVIAHKMGLTLNTVHAYSRRLFRKLGVNSKTQAIAAARHFGLFV